MHLWDLAGINGISRVLSVHGCQQTVHPQDHILPLWPPCVATSSQYSADTHRPLYGSVVVCHHVLESWYCLCDPVCVASGNLLYSRGSRGCYWDLLWWVWDDLDCWGICRLPNVTHVEHPWISLTFCVPVSFFIFTVLPWICEVGFGTCCTHCRRQLMNLCYLLQYICNDCLFVPSLLHWIEVTPNCFWRDPTLQCTACYWCL